MALVLRDRIKETTSTTGTGTITLNGATSGFQSFSVVGDGNTTYYAITSGTAWEVGVGTYTSSGTTLSRDTVLESSSGGAAISLTDISTVFCTYPAERSVNTEDIGTLASQDANNVAITGGSISVDASPTTALEVATKAYVDNLVSTAIHFHESVRVESPDAAGNLNVTYNNGASGVGATLTNNGTQAALVMDGITLDVDDRVLIYAQTDATQNGIYVVTDIGSGSTNWVLTRSSDANTYSPADNTGLDEGSYFLITEGDTAAGESYVCSTVGTITFGTTNITFSQFSKSTNYIAGTNINLTGNVISVAGDIAVADGGTGASDAATARTNLDVPSKSGSGATGTWGISVTGNAATATNGVVTTGTYADPSWITSLDDGKVLPSMTGNSGRYLTTNGTDSSWATVTLPTVNDGTLTLATSGTGLSGSASFTANQAGAGSFTVTSNATNANTASTIVARDASGNFSAGTITASLSGNATTVTNGVYTTDIGSTVQAYDAGLADIAGLAVTDGNFIVGDGANWVAESGATVRTSLGLGSLATLSTISNDNWSGTDLAVANGGTGAATLTANNVLLGNGTSAVQFVAPSTSGNVLQSNGTTWTSAPVPGSYGGATISTANITLTNTSTRLQVIDSATNIGTVTLPDATTFATEGSDIFLVKNFSPYTMDIVYSDGWYGNKILTGNEISISLADNTSAVGGWTPTNDSRLKTKQAYSFTATGVLDYTYDIAVMSDTKVICLYSGTGADIYYSVGTISDGVISWTSATLLLATTVYKLHLARLTDTTAILVSVNASGDNAAGTLAFFGLTLTGSTVTISPGVTRATSLLSDINPIDGTRAFVNYANQSNSVCRVITHNGASAPTLGTETTLIGGAYSIGVKTMASTLVDTNKFVTFYTAASSAGNTYARVSSISGTSITFGTQLTLSTLSGVYCQNKQAYSTNANYAFNTNGWGVSISGTTLTSLGLVSQAFNNANSIRNTDIALLPSNNGVTINGYRTKYTDAKGMQITSNVLNSLYFNGENNYTIRPNPSKTFAVSVSISGNTLTGVCIKLIET